MSPLFPASIPRAPRSVGRPRSESSRAAILESAWESLRESSVASITTLQIARRAGVSTATIYRWWPTREALLLEAFLDRANREIDSDPPGTPLEKLRQHVLETARFLAGGDGRIVAGLLSAIQENTLLREEFYRHILTPHEQEYGLLVAAAKAQGELPEATDAGEFLDAVLGPMLARLLVGREKVSEAFAAQVFEWVVTGLRSAQC